MIASQQPMMLESALAFEKLVKNPKAGEPLMALLADFPTLYLLIIFHLNMFLDGWCRKQKQRWRCPGNLGQSRRAGSLHPEASSRCWSVDDGESSTQEMSFYHQWESKCQQSRWLIKILPFLLISVFLISLIILWINDKWKWLTHLHSLYINHLDVVSRYTGSAHSTHGAC